MKQGPSTSSHGQGKVEPRSRGVNPGPVAEIGLQVIRTRSEPMYIGRGIEAPKTKDTIHHCGSQGKHR